MARSGRVQLELDVSGGNGTGAYELTLALPSVELRFEIPGADATKALASFVRACYGRTEYAALDVGTLDGMPVRLIKDNEHGDRFFVRAGGGGMVEVSIVDPVAGDLVRAAESLAAEAASCAGPESGRDGA